MNHIVFFRGPRTVCPCCGGGLRQLKSDDIILACIDCGVVLRAVGEGQAEAELEFEEVEIG